MSLYVRILKTDLERLHQLNKEKTAYITKLREAYESIERQIQNIKDANEEQTQEVFKHR